MSKKFQIVGSLLRPTDLLKYKNEIEHRDDIAYPFYNEFEGYEECEAKATHELFLIKVPETLDLKAFMHPVTIMTRAPVAISIVKSSFLD